MIKLISKFALLIVILAILYLLISGNSVDLARAAVVRAPIPALHRSPARTARELLASGPSSSHGVSVKERGCCARSFNARAQVCYWDGKQTLLVSDTGSVVQGNYVHDLHVVVDAPPGVDPDLVGGAEGTNNIFVFDGVMKPTPDKNFVQTTNLLAGRVLLGFALVAARRRLRKSR